METSKKFERIIGVFVILGIIGGLFYLVEAIIKAVFYILLLILKNPVNSIFVTAFIGLLLYQFFKTKNK